MYIITKKFKPHYNRSLGKFVSTRRQYKSEMKRQGCIPQEEANDIAKRAREKNHKPYKSDPETIRFYNHVKGKSRKGKVKLEGRELEYMKKKGVSFERPKERGIEGGFDDAV